MTRLTLACTVGAVAAAVVAWRLGGTLGTGVLAGYLLGAGVSGLGVLYQRHTLMVRPERMMQAVVVGFLAKLVFLFGATLVFRFVDAAAARADWRSFLAAFGVAVAIVLPLGSLDVVSFQKRRMKTLDPERTV